MVLDSREKQGEQMTFVQCNINIRMLYVNYPSFPKPQWAQNTPLYSKSSKTLVHLFLHLASRVAATLARSNWLTCTLLMVQQDIIKERLAIFIKDSRWQDICHTTLHKHRHHNTFVSTGSWNKDSETLQVRNPDSRCKTKVRNPDSRCRQTVHTAC
jgi:hypothetical protein